MRLVSLALLPLLAIVGLFGADTSSLPAPTVIVYPLTGTGSTPSEAGGNVALLLSTRLSQLGGLNVKPATPGTARSAFLTAALNQGADYYITGYLTPVGDDVSLIAQLVSTQSGSIVYSTTATVRTYADVVAQADPLREAILHHAARGLPTVQDVTPVTTTPEPIGSQGVNLTKALGRHRGRATPSPVPSAAASPAPSLTPSLTPALTPAPSPAPSPVATPGSMVSTLGKNVHGLVIDVEGNANPSARTRAANALALALRHAGIFGELLPVTPDDVAKNAASLCAANPATVAFFIPRLDNSGLAITLATSAVGCDGATLGRYTATRSTSVHGGLDGAIDQAAAESARALEPALAPAIAGHT